MAIQTYADLQDAIGNWTAGQLASARIQECIALAEAEMGRVLYPNAEEVRAQAVTVSGEARLALPQDCRKVRALRYLGARTVGLNYQSPVMFDRLAPSGSGQPTLYTVEANGLRLAPTPDDAYSLEIIYQQGVTALSDGNTSNDLLAQHSDLYLAGGLMHAFDFLMDETRAQKWRQRFAEIAQTVYLEQDRLRFAAPLQMRSPYREMR